LAFLEPHGTVRVLHTLFIHAALSDLWHWFTTGLWGTLVRQVIIVMTVMTVVILLVPRLPYGQLALERSHLKH
jgi:hypothetical protein